jgi:hypothetical protein
MIPVSPIRIPRVATVAGFACAAGLAATCASGAPILRHDWSPPYLSVAAALGSISGWEPSGLGTPIGAPSSYIAFPLQTLLQALMGPWVAAVVVLFAVGLVLALSAQSLARAFSASTAAQIAAAVFIVFNPWVYTKLVAGHVYILLSYGGTILLLREILAPSRSQLRLMLCGLLIGPQTQFFVVSFFPAIYVAAARRQRLALTTWLLLALPLVVGVGLNRSSLLGTPLTISWETTQSIQPDQALVLSGYFTSYAASFAGPATYGMWTIAGLAALGCVAIVVADRKRLLLPLATAATLLVSFGTHAPWADLVRLAFVRIPEIGLFRELYDLLGLTAVGYLALCACAVQRVRGANWLWLAASACLLTGWIARPPQTFWVPAQDVPRAPLASPANSRFALLPAFQPLSFEGRGSGIDPDAYVRPDGVTPLNQMFPLYPVATALRSYQRDGNAGPLAALSVSCIVARPWLRDDYHARKGQVALRRELGLPERATPATTCIDYLPELTLSAAPAVGTLDTNFGAGNVFFGDARAARGSDVPSSWKDFGITQSVLAPNTFVDARDGWVDARLGFVVDPELSQAFGGALTIDPDALLPVRPGLDALVYVRGRLTDARGRSLSGATRGYRWIALPSDTTAVRCAGLCVVALQGTPPKLPLNPPVRPARGVDFHSSAPWFAVATLPAGAASFLRYNVAYNDLWVALVDGRALSHVRVDGIVNGWFLPARDGEGRLYLIECGAFATACAEAISFVGLLLTFVVGLRRERGRVPLVRYRDAARVADALQPRWFR